MFLRIIGWLFSRWMALDRLIRTEQFYLMTEKLIKEATEYLKKNPESRYDGDFNSAFFDVYHAYHTNDLTYDQVDTLRIELDNLKWDNPDEDDIAEG